MNFPLAKPKTSWQPVFAMALMQGAIVLCWIVYRLYISDLLGQFGFPNNAALIVLAIESFLAALIEPLFGSLSDRQKVLWGLQIPFVTLGVLIASALLLLLPCMVLLGNPKSVLRWLFIFVVIFWSMAMATFRSPMLALLGKFARQQDWPYAASVLTFVGLITGSLALPTSKQILQGLGAVPAFGLSSIILLLSATLLNWSQPAQTDLLIAVDHPQPSRQNLVLITLTGSTVTLGVILMQQLIGLVGKAQTPMLMTALLVVQLVTVLPIGKVAQRWSNIPTMMLGLGLLGIGLGTLIVPFQFFPLVAVFPLGLGMSCVGVAAVPFALNMVPPPSGGLGIGLYFGGAALTGLMFSLYISYANEVPLFSGWVVGLFSFIGAITLLWVSRFRVNQVLSQ